MSETFSSETKKPKTNKQTNNWKIDYMYKVLLYRGEVDAGKNSAMFQTHNHLFQILVF